MWVDSQGYMALGESGKRMHIIVAERALGHALPTGAHVHHVNEIRTDFTNSNLVICQDAAYHFLLHYRAKAYDATGNASFVKCGYCHGWSSPLDPEIEDYSDSTYRHRIWHRSCQRRHDGQARSMRRAIKRASKTICLL